VQALVTASDLALERLAEKYVVKSIGIPGEPQQWELVHDGLGEPLQSWAGGLKNTLSDALAGITVLRGQDLVLPGADEAEAVAANISLINWRGCWAGPDDGRSLLADVTFTSCILVGTLFADCDFRNVAFVDCDLDGSIFDRCSFETVRFEGGNAEGLTFRNSDMAGVTFEGSWLNHLGLREVELRGLVAFDDVEILAGTITGLSRSIESACVDLTNACVSYSWWDAASEALIRLGDNTANSSANVRLGPSA
jgi:hypothetical protein